MSTWNDRMKDATATLAGEIPEAGFAVSAIINLFWPSSKQDVWDQIKDRVQALVDKSILDYELQERREEIDGLKDNMEFYTGSKINEKGAWIVTLIADSNILYEKLTGSSNHIHLIGLAVTASILHLTFLKERLVHGKEIFGEDNTPHWRNELESTLKDYQQYFLTAYDEWLVWRKSKISARSYTRKDPLTIPPFFQWAACGAVNDTLGVEGNFKFEHHLMNSDTYFKPAVDAAKERMINNSIASMASILEPTFYIHNILENDGKYDVNPKLATIAMGPYSGYSLGYQGTESSFIPSPTPTNTDAPGKIIGAIVHAGDSFESLQLLYSDHAGNVVGSKGGNKFEAAVPSGQYVVGAKIHWAGDSLVAFQFVYSSGSTSNDMHCNHNTGATAINVTPDPAATSREMVSASYSEAAGGHYGPGAVWFHFQYKPRK